MKQLHELEDEHIQQWLEKHEHFYNKNREKLHDLALCLAIEQAKNIKKSIKKRYGEVPKQLKDNIEHGEAQAALRGYSKNKNAYTKVLITCPECSCLMTWDEEDKEYKCWFSEKLCGETMTLTEAKKN